MSSLLWGILMQAARQPSSRMDAADAVVNNDALYQRLLTNFKSLRSCAQQYAHSPASGGYAYAGSALNKTTQEANYSPHNVPGNHADILFSALVGRMPQVPLYFVILANPCQELCMVHMSKAAFTGRVYTLSQSVSF